MFPKDILLKIVHYAHLGWVNDNLKALETNNVIFEQKKLTNNFWYTCVNFCNVMYGKHLRERSHKISKFENDLFQRMYSQSNAFLKTESDITIQLKDIHGEFWDFSWGWDIVGKHYQLYSINVKNSNNDFWGRTLNKRWGGNIGQSVLRFENIKYNSYYSTEGIGLFIYFLYPVGQTRYVDFWRLC
jgi:hypothetical protein